MKLVGLLAINSVTISVSASSRWLEGIRKWYYNAAGFNKLGEYLCFLLLFSSFSEYSAFVGVTMHPQNTFTICTCVR